MKRIVCEMCQSTAFSKEGDFFVCQNCGMKYSAENAQNLMVEVADNQASSNNGDVHDLEKLIKLAQIAVESGNLEDTKKYSDKILEVDPDHYLAWKFKAQMEGWSSSIANDKTKQSVVYANKAVEAAPEDQKQQIAEELLAAIVKQNLGLIQNAQKMPTNSSAYVHNLMMQWLAVIQAIPHVSAKAMQDQIELCKAKCQLWSQTNAGFGYYLYNHSVPYYISFAQSLAPLIQKENPDYQPPTQATPSSGSNSSRGGGCYVATCVYGSYDCPQVWTLRRFRDNTLSQTWFGRVFVRVYYAVSPTLVKWFGESKWFKTLWRSILDKMVRKFQSEGIESTPYNDKVW